eukprot:264713-Pelagomonas_calceolata.AAC.1
MKSMSGVHDGCQVLDSMKRKVYAGHRLHALRKGPLTSKLARASSLFNLNKVYVPVLRRDLGKIKVRLSTWDRAHKDSIRAALVLSRGASTIRENPVWNSS